MSLLKFGRTFVKFGNSIIGYSGPVEQPETVHFGEHEYGIVRIGNLEWITQNLYEPTDNFGNTAYTTSCWACHFDESGDIVWNTDNYNNAGMLYDGAVLNSDWMNNEILHDGWRVPTDDDVLNLMAECGIPPTSAYNYNSEKKYLLMDTQYGAGYDVLGFHGIESGMTPLDHTSPHSNWYPTFIGFFTKNSTTDTRYNHEFQIQDTDRTVGMRLFTTIHKGYRVPIRLCRNAT